MSKRAATALAVAASLAAVAAPVLMALYEARAQALDAGTARVLAYARDVLARTDATANQIGEGIARIQAVHSADPCSDASVQAMRDVDVASSYIQAIGYASGNRLVCSSLGPAVRDVPLGPVDTLTTRGVAVRANVALPFGGGRTFIVVESAHYAAIVHKALPVDITTAENDVALAAFMMKDRRVLAARGVIKSEWLAAFRPDWDVTFVRDGFVVAAVPSSQHFVGAIAAAPVTFVAERVHAIAVVLVPIGIVAGAGLALAVLRLARQQFAMPAVMRAALRRREFSIVYEPIVDLHTRRWIGAEAHLRWRRPSGEAVRPEVFLPAAEDVGLIERFTERTIDLVADDAPDLFRSCPDVVLAINLWPDDLRARRTVERLLRLAQAAPGGGANILVEVTERGLLSRDAGLQAVSELHAHGIRVTVDHFGVGFSNFSYLENFQLDSLKIARAFVETLNTEAPTSAVAFHIIQMGRTLNLQLAAEGVETEAQAQYLRNNGVRYAQGPLFAKALGADELAAALVAQRAAGSDGRSGDPDRA